MSKKTRAGLVVAVNLVFRLCVAGLPFGMFVKAVICTLEGCLYPAIADKAVFEPFIGELLGARSSPRTLAFRGAVFGCLGAMMLAGSVFVEFGKNVVGIALSFLYLHVMATAFSQIIRSLVARRPPPNG